MNARQSLLVGAALLLSPLAFGQVASAKIQQVAWLEGRWCQTRGADTVQETWLGPKGTLMAGVNLTHSARRGASFEYFRIVEEGEGLTLLASPGGIAPVAFKAKEVLGQKVVFENLGHDFPQRVLYWKTEDGVLMARIEGVIQGKAKGIDWRFEPVK